MISGCRETDRLHKGDRDEFLEEVVYSSGKMGF
jgi:hypothetical protein